MPNFENRVEKGLITVHVRGFKIKNFGLNAKANITAANNVECNKEFVIVSAAF